MKAFKFEIVSDVSKIIRDAKNLEKATDAIADGFESLADKGADAGGDTAKALDKLTDASKKAADKIDDHTDDIVKDYKQAADKLAEAWKDSQKEVEKSAKNAADSAGDAARRSAQSTETATHEISESAQEVQSELAQNFGETMSSFDGSAESAIGIVSDTLGGLAGSMSIGGPIGALFLGGAAGIISALVTKWSEGSDEIEQRNQQMYDDMLENANAYFTNSQIVERFNKLMTGAEDGPISPDKMNDLVKASGLDRQKVALSVADPANHGKELTKALEAEAKAAENAEEKLKQYTDTSSGIVAQSDAKADAIRSAQESWDEYAGAVTDTSNSIKSNNKFLEENGYLIDSAGDAARDLETAQKASADALDEATNSIKENNKARGSAEAAARDNEAALSDLAGALIDEQSALADAGGSTKDLTKLQETQAKQFLKTADAAGIERDEAIALGKKLGLIPSNIATKIKEQGADNVKQKAAETKTAVEKVPKKIDIKTTLTTPSPTAVAGAVSTIESLARPVRIRAELAVDRTKYNIA